MKLNHVFGVSRRMDREQMDINVSDKRNPYAPYASTCFHAHQFVEKTLKDALEIKISEVRRGHNLVSLLGELAEKCGASDDDRYDEVEEMCKRLTKHYYDARYPDDRTFVQRVYTVDDARQAVEDAEQVVEWIGGLEVLDGVLYKDSWSVRRGARHKVRTFSDTPAYRRTVSEYSKLLRLR